MASPPTAAAVGAAVGATGGTPIGVRVSGVAAREGAWVVMAMPLSSSPPPQAEASTRIQVRTAKAALVNDDVDQPAGDDMDTLYGMPIRESPHLVATQRHLARRVVADFNRHVELVAPLAVALHARWYVSEAACAASAAGHD